MKSYKKADPPGEIRRFLEPGPIVLVSSRYRDRTDIMTMGWHMVMDDSGAMIGCFLWDRNYSYELVRKSRECVFNIPTLEMASTVVKIGNCSGRNVDKFEKFGLTPDSATKVKAPLIRECFANFECKLVDDSLVKKRNLFIFKVVKAHVAKSPRHPRTLPYRGDGEFMISGANTHQYRKYFLPSRL